MKSLISLSCVALLVIFSSCAPKVYYSPDAKSISSTHEIIAIAPPLVTIAARKNIDPEALKNQQALESSNFQKEMYSWLLHRKMQNRLFVDIQDVETTVALLEQAGYYEGKSMTPAQISDVLEVDAIITSNFSLTKPISDLGAVALKVFFDDWYPTNRAQVTLSIHDRENEKAIWNYHHEVSGTLGSTPERLVHDLMRNASRKMPYN